MSSFDRVPVERLDVSWGVDDVSVRGDEVRVSGDVLVDVRAREIDLFDVCTRQLVGRGLWTRTRLVWWLSPADLAGALVCTAPRGQALGVSARRSGTHPLQSSEGVSVSLSLAADDGSVGIAGMAILQEGSDTVVSVDASAPDALRLQLGHDVVGPVVSGNSARFVLPTAVVVRAALRGEHLHVASAEADASARVQLIVNGQDVAPPPPPPPTEEEEDRG